MYLDNASTTKVCKRAADAVVKAMTEEYGNPSSGHLMGRKAKNLADEARKIVAKALGAEPEEIFFTSGGTEADNWAVVSAANMMARKGRHIVSTAIEHEAVKKPLDMLAKKGFRVDFIRPFKDGSISPEQLEETIGAETVLVSVMAVCNETGNVYPVKEISKIIKRKKSPALLHTDAVQGFLKIPISAVNLGADMITISGHKVHGPKGIGALYIKKGLKLPPLLYGGGQERGNRSGTEAIPLISGFGAAVEEGFYRLNENIEHMKMLRDFLISEFNRCIPEIKILGNPEAPHIIAIALPGYKSEVIMNYLDNIGIYLSKGSACKKGKRSYVLESMGLSPELMDASLRISLSPESTRQEISDLVAALISAKNAILPDLK
ncbi:MAG: cysteine desulfurase [Clostridiales bacterium]|nr:cysteine desulfurase [Clostridiales bacterium]